MNEQQQAELRALREEQRVLAFRLRLLDERLLRLEDPDADTTAAVSPLSTPVVPPPPLPEGVQPPEPDPVPATPPPLPSLAVTLQERPAVLHEKSAQEFLAARTRWGTSSTEPAPAAVPPPPRSTPVEPATPPARRDSLEVQIGSRWLVYGGVVLLLTALAFFGTYLYQNIVPHLGPGAKVALLYLGTGGLTAGAAFLERSRQARDNPRLGTYAQTLLAAGLAGVYYVTYLAHYSERLRVIDNSLLAGAALLAWTAFMVFLAHRRRSETIATVGILLAYYTSAVNEGVVIFTLFSNLALTGGAVFLLRRHLWRVFPFASLLATFGSYAFWTYYHSVLGWRGEFPSPPIHAHHGSGGFWVEGAFLAVYWALFTWAAFTAGEDRLPSLRRASFVSINNGAFYGLVTWLVLGESPVKFWQWSLGFGVVLLALAEACRRLARSADGRTEGVYLLQGVLLVTTGLIAYFDGWQLGLALAMEAITLLAGAGRRRSRLLLGCSALAALGALAWTLQSLHAFPPVSWIPPLGVGAFLVGAAYLAQVLRERTVPEGATAPFAETLRSAPAYYALLGSVVWFVLIADRAPTPGAQVTLYAGAALALTASVYALRIKALPLYAQGFLFAGFLTWMFHQGIGLVAPSHLPGWITLGLLAAVLALGHWWQQLPGPTGWTRETFSRFLDSVDALAAVAIVFFWFSAEVWTGPRPPGSDAAESAGLALGILIYALATRYKALAVASQGLLFVGIVFFLGLLKQGWNGNLAEPLLAVVPLLVLLGTLGVARFFLLDTLSIQVWMGTLLYETLTVLLFLPWVGHYFPAETWLPVYALAGTALFALGVQKGVRRWLLLSAAPTAAGLWSFFVLLSGPQQASFLSLLGASLLAAEQQFGRRRLGDRLAGWFPTWAQGVLMTAAVLCAWVFVTERVSLWRESSITLAAGWSVFAATVFAAGWFLRERVYRWLALLVLAVTLGHIVWFDLTGLDSLGKAISFFALAVVALLLGFLYTKFQDKFRDLL